MTVETVVWFSNGGKLGGLDMPLYRMFEASITGLH